MDKGLIISPTGKIFNKKEVMELIQEKKEKINRFKYMIAKEEEVIKQLEEILNIYQK